jgi:hypothetical protein
MDYVKVFEVKFKVDDYLKALEQLKQRIDELRARQKELRKAGQTATKEYVEITAQIKQLSQTYRKLEKELIANARAEKKHADIIKAANKELARQATTIEQLQAQINTLNHIKRQLNFENENERALIEKINGKIDELVEKRRKLEDSDTKRVMNIGRYAEAMKKVLLEDTKFIELTRQQNELLGFIAEAIENLGGKTKGLGLVTKMAMGPILLFVQALMYLWNALKESASGIQKLRNVIYPVKAVISELTNRIKLFAGAVYDMGTALAHLDWDRFKAAASDAANTVKTLGKGLKDAWQRGKDYADLVNALEYWKRVNVSLIAQNNIRLAQIEKELKLGKVSYEQQIRLLKEKYSLQAKKLEARKKELELEYRIAQIDARSGKKSDIDKMLQVKAELENLKAEAIRLTTEMNEALEQAKREHFARLAKMIEDELKLYYEKNLQLNQISTAEDQKTLEIRYQMWKRYFERKRALIEAQAKAQGWTETEKQIAYAQLENEKKALDDAYQKRLEYFRQKQEDFERRKKQIELEVKQLIAEAYPDDEQAQIELLEAQKQRELETWQQYWDKHLISYEQFEKARAAITEKYEKAIAEVKKKSTQSQISDEESLNRALSQGYRAWKAIAGAMFKDNKDISIAIATIDTLYSAQKAFRAEMEKGGPYATIAAFAAAAAVLAAGYERIRQMQAVEPGQTGTGFVQKKMDMPTTANSTALVSRSVGAPTTGVQAAQTAATENENQNVIRVVNVARETVEVADDEIYVENVRNI